jgi:hypothetical protein
MSFDLVEIPNPLKAQRELTGQLAITFLNGDTGKEFVRSFTELRAGISWPIRALPGYMAIVGLYSGAVFGKPDSLMLLYEKEYPDSIQLMTDAYNKANDLRFQLFYTNRQKDEWNGFNSQFLRKIRELGSRDIRLNHSPFAADFMMGKDVIKRLASEKALHIPKASLFMKQIYDFSPDRMNSDHPEHEFHAMNGMRYILVPWDLQGKNMGSPAGGGERKISVAGWA